MRYIKAISVLSILVVIAFLGTAFGDEIRLKNGDRLSGKIVSMEKDLLILSTSYAGKVSVKWDEVALFSTDEPVTVDLGSDTRVRGMAKGAEEGKIAVNLEGGAGVLTFNPSQVKALNPSPPPPALTLGGHINVGVNVADGNSETTNIYADAEMVARTEKNRFTMGGRHSQTKEDQGTTSENTKVYGKYDYFLTDKWYLLATATGIKDRFKDLNLRTMAGLGMGYQFLDTKLTKLSLEAGLSYVNDDYKEAEDENYAAGRWAANFSHFLVEDRIQFFHSHEGFVSLEDAKDVLISSQTGFRLPILDRVSATAQLNYDWDNSPSEGKKRADTLYIFTLGYAW